MQKLLVEDLTVEIGGKMVLKSVSLQLQHIDIVGVVGANGAGKTTLLNTLAGLVPVANGKIYLDGNDITCASPDERLRRSMSYVPDGSGVFSTLTVRENLVLGGHIRQSGDIEPVLSLLPDLGDCLESFAGSLTTFQRRQCAFGRALMSQPSLLMVDELSLGLSPIAADALARLLPDIAAHGVAIIVVEQDIDRALSLVDRAYVLEAGAVTLEGTPGELLSSRGFVDKYLWGS